MRHGLAVASVLLAGCGGADRAPDPTPDSTLVEVLADLHLADARAVLDSTRQDPAFADSLRRAALSARDLDSTALAERLDALAADPALMRATYDALDARLGLERQGVSGE